jgi:hypothetical protein
MLRIEAILGEDNIPRDIDGHMQGFPQLIAPDKHIAESPIRFHQATIPL